MKSQPPVNLRSPELVSREHSMLFVIDMQEDTIASATMAETVLGNCLKLVDVALRLQIPTTISAFLTEQHGEILPELLALLPDIHVRKEYSAAAVLQRDHSPTPEESVSGSNPPVPEEADFRNVEQCILVGAHLSRSITQTALDLLCYGKRVYVVVDAVFTRRPELQDVILQRLLVSGVTLITTDALLAEWSYCTDDVQFDSVRSLLDG